ncbi:DNA-binding transcriptional regulator, XRE family [Eubacterium uniforme]|uniref:DNA-binding transcriptional regulator, XRE family n=1 Tax=Eubacterium uniforme TaxID=39495 RepID=A0A1T4W0N2_9FIRM|nr:helix-turn-helix transcriptional regulator [Eubacterium uniforme]SKA70291.1 DNA-binding transcriptional regulator, XRE family [Eubacterium uniforme]
MIISYNKLWKKLIDNKMNKKDIIDSTGMSPSTMAKMGRDEFVSLDVLVRICEIFNCDIGDIMEVINEKVEEK